MRALISPQPLQQLFLSWPFQWVYSDISFWFSVVFPGTSLLVQWPRLHTPNARDLRSIPGWGTISHMLQLKTLHATTKTRCSQRNKNSVAWGINRMYCFSYVYYPFALPPLQIVFLYVGIVLGNLQRVLCILKKLLFYGKWLLHSLSVLSFWFLGCVLCLKRHYLI